MADSHLDEATKAETQAELCVVRAGANGVNPIEKVIKMMSDLETVMMSRLSSTL